MQTARQSTKAVQPGPVTLVLTNMTDPNALDTLVRLVYDELHDMALHFWRLESPGRSLQPTALLHETFIRFIEDQPVFKNHRHFFASAARTMKRILVDDARRRNARKRGGKSPAADFGEAERIGFETPAELLDLDAALTRLNMAHPSWSEVVDLRIFGGWTTTEISTILHIGESTARRRWTKAKAWLKSDLRES